MPDPNPSNRERLLRLIDGGHEALKEFAKPIPVKPVPKKQDQAVAVWAAFKRRLAEWQKKLPVSKGAFFPVLRWLVVLVLILAAFHYGLEALKTVKGQEKALPAAGQTPAAEDESGIGLRLVGVDTSEPPVALLEDLKTGKTYFARANEQVKGARVKLIQKNKVTLSVRGKTVELR